MSHIKHYLSTKADVRDRVTSVKAWQLPQPDSNFAPKGTWTNHDMEPVPPSEWSWTTSTFILYWMSDLVQGSTWSAIASLFSLGLTWWEGLLAIFFGGTALCIVVSANGLVGAMLHTPFAVTCRATYGYHFSKFCVISRMVIAWFWFSIQTYSGGLGVTQLILAMAPSYANFPNHLPASAGVTSQEFLSFFIFWLLQFPFCLVHPRRLRPIFLAKGILLPIVAVGTMGWAIHQAGDQAGPSLSAKSTLHGKAGFLAFMTAVSSQTGQWVTLACNVGDFSRYLKEPKSALAQILFVPAMWSITAMFGAIATCCLQAVYGEILYTPFQITQKWLDTGSSTGRFFAFVCSLAWILGYIGLNITANSISAANDSAALLPRYISIFRGQMIAVTVGVFAFAPWKVMSSASSIVSFAGSYGCVLAPMASVMAADYFFVKGRKIDVPALYDPHGIYYYAYGVNWRSVCALVIAIGPLIPGMGHALDTSFKIGDWQYLYACSVVYSMVSGALVHIVLSRLFPHEASLIEEAVYAHEVLAARSTALQLGQSDSLEQEEEKEDGARIAVVAV
ncbi:permease for cytosine/purines, uracil, thiamine, allantoin-domain-containing protein [Leucosporidium creatinivorum]|uniref:Permease for cytosine/purines, uracil, thiamine, allantoin-domain-containing protein n=1 Tax=Leucosporidium creatinivorum TaxID=106004 RepID=A0A1Y2FCX8_9BASI|nr:permease for cytosine/purines, uracil, thiamine, allantoin-domain-containing protein [Leucosporidium creatinivorum]